MNRVQGSSVLMERWPKEILIKSLCMHHISKLIPGCALEIIIEIHRVG